MPNNLSLGTGMFGSSSCPVTSLLAADTAASTTTCDILVAQYPPLQPPTAANAVVGVGRARASKASVSAAAARSGRLLLLVFVMSNIMT